MALLIAFNHRVMCIGYQLELSFTTLAIAQFSLAFQIIHVFATKLYLPLQI